MSDRRRSRLRRKEDNSPEEDEYVVETIIDKRSLRGQEQYLIKWEDYAYKDCTWEPTENLENLKDQLDKFNKEKPPEKYIVDKIKSYISIKGRKYFLVKWKNGLGESWFRENDLKKRDPQTVEAFTKQVSKKRSRSSEGEGSPAPKRQRSEDTDAEEALGGGPILREDAIKICGAKRSNDTLLFLVKWSSNEKTWLELDSVRYKFPQLVIDFLTSKLIFGSFPPNMYQFSSLYPSHANTQQVVAPISGSLPNLDLTTSASAKPSSHSDGDSIQNGSNA
eukprot:gb/GECH01013928.1/.p1 GENE.gb/GECH01013928.1/~~gb/GECH01013928.1/.p1  ORF type:complete len:278 (+),score=55.11 gb/GECH01013928.1/:1-834(+)